MWIGRMEDLIHPITLCKWKRSHVIGEKPWEVIGEIERLIVKPHCGWTSRFRVKLRGEKEWHHFTFHNYFIVDYRWVTLPWGNYQDVGGN